MKYTTKKPLEGVKIWAEDELIDTKNVIVCSTPPKEGEKFTGIGFLIWQNKQLYMVGDEEGKCKVLNKIPEGWKKLNRNLNKDLICHFIDYGRNHKNYDKYNTYFKLLRRKLVKTNILLLSNPLNNVPFLTQVTNEIRKDTSLWFQPHQFFKYCKKNPSLVYRDYHYSEKITYFELLDYKNRLNKKHIKYCQILEQRYHNQKKFIRELTDLEKQNIKRILRLGKDDNEK